MFTQAEKDAMQATINALAPLIEAHEATNHPPTTLSESAACAFVAKRDSARTAAESAMIPILRASNWPEYFDREVHKPVLQSAHSALIPFCRCENSALQIARGLHAVKITADKKSAFCNFENPSHAFSVAKMVVADFTGFINAA